MFTSPQHLHSVCLGLHIFLLLIHLTLFAVWACKAEHRFVFDLNKGNKVSSILSSILQVYITVYSTVVLFFTQSISIRRSLLHRQTLTATHDITGAWGGLGAAVLSLYNQFFITASVGGVSGVTAYLTCLSVLHIATPTLFTLQLFNATSSLMVETTLARPNATYDDFFVGYTSVRASTLPLLSRLQSSTPGLMGPTIFDVLQVSSGIGNATVNATTFSVTCGSIQGQFLSKPPNIKRTFIDHFGNLTFFSDQTGDALINTFEQLGPNMLNTSGSLMIYHTPSTQIVLISSYNFSDSQGVIEPLFSLPSTLEIEAYDLLSTIPYNYSISSLQVFGCNLSAIEHTAIVDVQSGNLVQILKPEDHSSEWTSSILTDSTPRMDFFDAWPGMFSGSPQLEEYYGTLCQAPAVNLSDYECYQPVSSAIDSAIMPLLGLTSFMNPSAPVPQQLTLGMLEDAIANTTAMVFWFFARYTNASGPVDLTSRQPKSLFLSSSKVNVTQSTLMFRLQLNAFQLVGSMLMAVILLFLAIILTSGAGGASLVDNVGVLQCLWLSHQHPVIQRSMLKIENPSAAELRKEGMKTVFRLGASQVSEDSTESIGLILEPFQFPNIDNSFELQAIQ